jgi:hypothetical protein
MADVRPRQGPRQENSVGGGSNGLCCRDPAEGISDNLAMGNLNPGLGGLLGVRIESLIDKGVVNVQRVAVEMALVATMVTKSFAQQRDRTKAQRGAEQRPHQQRNRLRRRQVVARAREGERRTG